MGGGKPRTNPKDKSQPPESGGDKFRDKFLSPTTLGDKVGDKSAETILGHFLGGGLLFYKI